MENVSIQISEIAAHEQRPEVTLPDGSKATAGRTLREWLDRLGGPRGQMDSPAGTVDVDLTPWLGRDPDATILRVNISFRRPSKIGRSYPGTGSSAG